MFKDIKNMIIAAIKIIIPDIFWFIDNILPINPLCHLLGYKRLFFLNYGKWDVLVLF